LKTCGAALKKDERKKNTGFLKRRENTEEVVNANQKFLRKPAFYARISIKQKKKVFNFSYAGLLSG
jgi:hypothetical protein